MSEALIEELKRENLCTYFVLPLIKLNKFSFLQSNFINSYLSKDYGSIYVKIIDPALLSNKVKKHTMCKSFYKDVEGSFYIGYWIPNSFKKDTALFTLGKFSEISKGSKERILRYSGLPNREKDDKGQILTDGRLLALEKHPILIEMWERLLSSDWEKDKSMKGQVELPDGSELLSKPGPDSYIDQATLTPLKIASYS